MIKKKLIVGLIGTFAFVTHVNGALFSDIVGNHDVLVFDDVHNLGGLIIHGNLAAGRNVNDWETDNYFAKDNENGNYDKTVLIAGGDVDLSYGSVFGGIVAGGTVKTNEVKVYGNIASEVTDINSVFDFNEAKRNLTYVSNYFASQEAVHGVKENGIIRLTGIENADVNYFSITAEELNSCWEGQLENKNTLIFENLGHKNIVTVYGESADLQANINLYGNNSNSTFLWNFVDANFLALREGYNFTGSILAINANLVCDNGSVDGYVVAKSISAASTIKNTSNFDFDISIPPQNVPESSTASMVIAGVFILILVSKNRVAFSRK